MNQGTHTHTYPTLYIGAGNYMLVNVSGPYVETWCVFFFIKNIIDAELWA